MRKIFLPALVALLLVGCNNNVEEPVNPDKIFKDEISKALNIETTSKKLLMHDMSNDAIIDIVTGMMSNEYLKDMYVSYGEESQGIGTDDSGNKVFCYKLPIEIALDGGEKEIEELVNELDEIPSKISVSRFDITSKEDEFHVDAVVNFLGDIESTSISGKGPVNFKRNDVEVNEAEKIVLRDFDFNMTLRPSNSDSSAVTLGVKDSKKCLYSDENKKHDVIVSFSKQNGKFYAEYSIDGKASKSESFSSSGDIKFDILSCDRVLTDDYIDVDLTVNNSSGKKVSIVIYDDASDRVKVVSKSGSVEVLEK